LVEYVFISRHDISKWFSWDAWYKNFLVNQSCQKFRHIWLQYSELKSWLSAYCLSCWFKKSLLPSLQWCNHTEILRA